MPVWRQNYAVALSNALSSEVEFHTAFATGIVQGKQAISEGQHRDTLPAEPHSWKQMLKHRFAANFKKAAEEEIQSLEKRETFKWVPKEAIQSALLLLLWVFIYKFDTDAYLTNFKARLCVRGDLQSAEQDKHRATLAARTFRALLAIVAAFDLEIQQYDAVNVFVNSKLNEDIYYYSSEGFERQGSCWHLLRALYGLKQSPLLWYTDFTAALEELGLYPIPGVNCLYANDHLFLFFYVDDIVILYSKQHHDEFEQFEHGLLQHFEMRSLENLTWFLGIRIKRERLTRRAWLCQDSYISKIATKFNINSNSKAPQIPLPCEELRAAVDGEQATAQQILAYRQRVGSLIFAAVITRPDIAHTASKLAQFLINPTSAHLGASNCVIAYLYGTRNLAIGYAGHTNLMLQIFECSSDAAFADDVETRYSSDGILFQLHGGLIDWRAAKQKTVTRSSTEAELL
jgi:Reverse transcriptase (RNA-dependent DNA polymerase)